MRHANQQTLKFLLAALCSARSICSRSSTSADFNSQAVVMWEFESAAYLEGVQWCNSAGQSLLREREALCLIQRYCQLQSRLRSVRIHASLELLITHGLVTTVNLLIVFSYRFTEGTLWPLVHIVAFQQLSVLVAYCSTAPTSDRSIKHDISVTVDNGQSGHSCRHTSKCHSVSILLPKCGNIVLTRHTL